MGLTSVVCLVLGAAGAAFFRDAFELVLQPIDRMILKVRAAK